jgi:O-antigen/teichoic acid export membrane protein
MAERVHKSILNAKVNLLFYFLTIFLSFFSRKIFLDCLGTEFIGLTGTLGNILGYLNLAELGIGSCVSFFLYKPLEQKNKEQIIEIMSVFRYLYRIIGLIILSAGIIVSLSFPWIFKDVTFGLGLVYFSFFSFLGSSLIQYFINYRQLLLAADQKNYIVSAYLQTAQIIKTIIQIYLSYTYKNLYLWVAIEFIFGILGCIVLNWKISKEYPWMHGDTHQGRTLLKKYPDIIKNTKQIFIHRIKDFLLRKSDELFIFAFVSLNMVSFYGNYTIITNRLSQLFGRAMDGIGASVGNLVAENNKEHIIDVFWQLMAMRYLITGFLCYSIYQFTEPFIILWLGEKYVLHHHILILLVVYLYLSNIRNVVDMFNHSYGLYADVWAAWAELFINLSITIVGGIYYGIIGILLGKIVSVGIIVTLWKPYYLFSQGIKLPINVYWSGTAKYHLIIAISFVITLLWSHILPLNPGDNFIQFIIFTIANLAVFCTLLVVGFYIFTPGTRHLYQRIKLRKK